MFSSMECNILYKYSLLNWHIIYAIISLCNNLYIVKNFEVIFLIYCPPNFNKTWSILCKTMKDISIFFVGNCSEIIYQLTKWNLWLNYWRAGRANVTFRYVARNREFVWSTKCHCIIFRIDIILCMLSRYYTFTKSFF